MAEQTACSTERLGHHGIVAGLPHPALPAAALPPVSKELIIYFCLEDSNVCTIDSFNGSNGEAGRNS